MSVESFPVVSRPSADNTGKQGTSQPPKRRQRTLYHYVQPCSLPGVSRPSADSKDGREKLSAAHAQTRNPYRGTERVGTQSVAQAQTTYPTKTIFRLCRRTNLNQLLPKGQPPKRRHRGTSLRRARPRVLRTNSPASILSPASAAQAQTPRIWLRVDTCGPIQ